VEICTRGRAASGGPCRVRAAGGVTTQGVADVDREADDYGEGEGEKREELYLVPSCIVKP
jgi:hypothetical protein